MAKKIDELAGIFMVKARVAWLGMDDFMRLGVQDMLEVKSRGEKRRVRDGFPVLYAGMFRTGSYRSVRLGWPESETCKPVTSRRRDLQ